MVLEWLERGASQSCGQRGGHLVQITPTHGIRVKEYLWRYYLELDTSQRTVGNACCQAPRVPFPEALQFNCLSIQCLLNR